MLSEVDIFVVMAEEEYKDFTSQEQIEEMQDNYKIDDYFPRIRRTFLGYGEMI